MRISRNHALNGLVLIGLILGGLGFALVPGSDGAQAVSPVQPKSGQPMERHPHIRKAITELRESKKELQVAAHDFGGHKKEAIKAVDGAIVQLEKALKFDRK